MKNFVALLLFCISFLSLSQEITIEEKVSSMNSFEGFIDFYFDESEDEIWWVLENFNREMLYINSLTAGLGSNDIGLDRNQLGDSRVVYFEKRGPKILMVQPNTYFRAESNEPLERKAVEEAFAKSVLWGFKIEIDEGDKVLVNATEFLMQDAHNISSRLSNQGSYSLNRSMSAFYAGGIFNFPKNSEFEATLTFTGNASGSQIKSVTPTPSNVTVRLHHSIVELPDEDFKKRKFDPRAGLYAYSYSDYATPISEPLEKKFIARHRLEKKNPSAKKSEPVEPIVYYLDSGTPEPIKSALLEGARWWNQAFEAAGYINAFRMEMLPEDAHPMDIRYNVINWVHRSTRGWSYGSSVSDPRTGEIIKGHVTLGSLRVRQDFLIAEGLLAPYKNGKTIPPEMEEMALARLRQLSAHEVGHTLGLSHNYSSSTEGRASVMDYPHPLVEINGNKLSLSRAYDNKIGAWDKVAIEYAYQDFPDNLDEETELGKIIDRSLKDGLTFLSDQDARPKGSAHPYAHLWDNGENAAAELARVLKIREIALNNFGEFNIRESEPYAHLAEVLAPIYFFHRYQTEAAVKLIGGLEYRYKLRGDEQFATKMIPAQVQLEALEEVLSTLDAKNLTLNEDLLKLLPPDAFGEYSNRENIKSRTGLTFDPLGAAESAANFTLELLIHPQRLARLNEYHSRDSSLPGIEKVLDALLEETIYAKKPAGLAGETAKTVDHLVIQHIFKQSINPGSPPVVKEKLFDYTMKIKDFLELKEDAHAKYLTLQIQWFLQDPGEYIEENPLDTPDGSPIGMEGYCGGGRFRKITIR